MNEKMNERIKEIYSKFAANPRYMNANDSHKQEEIFNEFAKLIVEDVAKFVGDQRNDVPARGWEFEAAIVRCYGLSIPYH